MSSLERGPQAGEQIAALERLQSFVDAWFIVARAAAGPLFRQRLPVDRGLDARPAGQGHRLAGDLAPFVLVEAEGLQCAVLLFVVEEEGRHCVDVGLIGKIKCIVVEQRHGQIVTILEYANVVSLLYGDPDVQSLIGVSMNGFEQGQSQIAGVAVFLDQGQQDRSVGRELLFLTLGVEQRKFGRWVHGRSLTLVRPD